MDFHKVAVEFSDSNLMQLQQFINDLGDLRSMVSIKKTETLKEESTSFYTFVVEADSIKEFLIKLKNFGLKIVSDDEINDRLRPYRKISKAKKAEDASKIGIEGLKHRLKKRTIQNFIDEGEYRELLTILKNIRTEQSKRKEAEAGIPKAVKNAIELNFDQAIANRNRAFGALEELISIASNPELIKDPKLDQIIKNAGNKAIQICETYKKFTADLIKISNNNKIPYSICIKAVIKFSEITMEDSRKHKPEYDEAIYYAINHTNLRWLRIVFATIGNVLSWEEKKHYTDFMSFIEFKKLGK
jgi:hypothetical protein